MPGIVGLTGSRSFRSDKLAIRPDVARSQISRRHDGASREGSRSGSFELLLDPAVVLRDAGDGIQALGR